MNVQQLLFVISCCILIPLLVADSVLILVVREGDMDVRLKLFSDRLKRLLEGEERMFPINWHIVAKKFYQTVQSVIESISSWLRYYQVDNAWLLIEIKGEDEVTRSDLYALMKEVGCIVSASEEAIAIIIMRNIQQNIDNFSKELSDALSRLVSKMESIKQLMLQVQHNMDFREWIKFRNITHELLLEPKERLPNDAMEELLDQLIEGPPQLSIVAMLNSFWFDMTDFAAESYNSHYVKSYFDCYAWVSFDVSSWVMLDRIMKIVIPQSALSKIKHMDFEQRRSVLHEYLRNKRYMIVVAHVVTTNTWDDLLSVVLPDHQNGSRVLAMFNEHEILSLCRMENGEMIDIDSVPARPLRATYGELPFVLLYYESQSLKNSELSSAIPKIFSLILNIAELPIYLKSCCLYLSVFNERSEISTRQLYQLWIAEGFIPDNSEATAEEYLKQLISGGIVKVKRRKAGGTIKACSGIISLIVQIAERSEFTHIYSEDIALKNSKRISIIPGALPHFLSLEHTNTFLHSLLHLTSERNHRVPLEYCNEICKKFKFLVSLDLGTILLEDYPTGVSNLLLLKYLKLDIPSLKCMPSSLCNLLNLLTLDMPSSYIEHTPDGIWKMNELRHLNFGFITLPAHPGNYYSTLENLNFISVLHPSSCTQDILQRLPSLQNLRIHGNLSSYQSMLSTSLCKLLCLESLKLVNESEIVSQHSTTVLTEYQFPPSLTQLSLSNIELRDDPMPILETLPNLQVLKLKNNSYIGKKIVCNSGGFPSLKILHLKSMFWLEDWTVGNEAMPKLESLTINHCAYLKRLPEELWRIKSFTKLEVCWPHYEFRESLRKFEGKAKYHIQIYPYGM